MYFTGIIIAIMTFLAIGVWHPIVIKTEYYWGTRPWVVYLLVGISCCVGALFTENVYLSSFLSRKTSICRRSWESLAHRRCGVSVNSLHRKGAWRRDGFP